MAIASRDRLVRFAYSFRGTPYKWGGDSLEYGCDCSGFVRCVLQEFDLLSSGDYSSQMLFNYYRGRATKEWLPGNLVFFGRTERSIYHVAILLDAHRMIEAAGGNSRTRSLAAALSTYAEVRVSMINQGRQDRMAVLDPFALEREVGSV